MSLQELGHACLPWRPLLEVTACRTNTSTASCDHMRRRHISLATAQLSPTSPDNLCPHPHLTPFLSPYLPCPNHVTSITYKMKFAFHDEICKPTGDPGPLNFSSAIIHCSSCSLKIQCILFPSAAVYLFSMAHAVLSSPNVSLPRCPLCTEAWPSSNVSGSLKPLLTS